MAMRCARRMRMVSGSSVGHFVLVPARNLSSNGGKGGILDDKERAQETFFIQKMERERLAKQKLNLEKENVPEKAKEVADKKAKDETHKD